MNAPLPRIEDHGTVDALLSEAQALLAQSGSEVPADFVVQLFGQTVPEDLARYAAEDIAMLAARGYAFLREREQGHSKVRCAPVTLPNSHERGGTTVLEALNDDMPFLVDSVLGEFAERRLTVTLVAHPVLRVDREGGQLTGLKPKGARESFIHLHIDGVRGEAECAAIATAIETVLNEVRRAVTDWRPMLARVNAIIAELKANPPPLAVEEIAEAIEFLQWLLADNFTACATTPCRPTSSCRTSRPRSA